MAKTPPAPPTPQALKDAAEHLQYEVTMFDQTARRLAAGMPDGTEKNAFLESFTIHLRALLDFMFPKESAKPDDLLAWHYVGTEQQWLAVRPGAVPPASNVSERVNKEIAHITLGRLLVGPAAKKWDITAIHREMVILLNLFLKHAPSANIAIPQDPLPTPPPTLLLDKMYSTSTTSQPTFIGFDVRSITLGPSHRSSSEGDS